MFFRSITLVVLMLPQVSVLSAEEPALSSPSMTMQPNKCVSLRQGRTCFADVAIQWQTPKADDYCLINSRNNKPLACWQNRAYAKITFSFAGVENEDFILVLKNTGQAVTSQTMEVTWLHKSPNRRRRWRLF